MKLTSQHLTILGVVAILAAAAIIIAGEGDVLQRLAEQWPALITAIGGYLVAKEVRQDQSDSRGFVRPWVLVVGFLIGLAMMVAGGCSAAQQQAWQDWASCSGLGSLRCLPAQLGNADASAEERAARWGMCSAAEAVRCMPAAADTRSVSLLAVDARAQVELCVSSAVRGCHASADQQAHKPDAAGQAELARCVELAVSSCAPG